jgi:hypothetical protein
MDAFWRSLGDFAAPASSLAGDGCGCSLGLAPGEKTIDASEAASRVVSQYVALSNQGEKLRQLMVAGVKIPCDVWAAYASARQDYIVKSQPLFDQLAAKGVTVEQVVYSGGKPKPDPSDPSKYVTLRVQAPLRPPAFVGINKECPTVPVMYGATLQGSIGWEPTPISLGSVASSVVSALGTAGGAMFLLIASNGTTLGLAGYGAYKTLKQVAVILQDYDASPSRILTAYTACFDSATKAGMSAADAAKQCQLVQTSAQDARVAVAKANAQAQQNSGLGFWAWVGIGAAVLVVGSIVVRIVRSRVGAAAALISPIGEVGRPISAEHDSIFLGDLYFQPRGRR